MIAVDVTSTEIESKTLSPEHLQDAVCALQEDGFVVLNDVVDPAHLALLREKMLDDVQYLLARDDAPFNFNTGNIQQEPPPFAPYLFRDVLLNDMVIAVTKAMLGPGLYNGFYSGNTTIPGVGQRQPVHVDTGQLWPNLSAATPPFSFVVNIPVVDMTPANGSTELWPGTHLDTTVSIQQGDLKVPPVALAERHKVRPPLQPAVRVGSVLIRDIRLWHAGMPNYTDQARPMIAMVHGISWWHTDEWLTFPKGTEEFFQHPDLHTRARFVNGPIDYIHHSEAYEFQPDRAEPDV
jgi:ectoine hydroxylase-related dioxygenase (phytanoyl-CoA dioxygenase family)